MAEPRAPDAGAAATADDAALRRPQTVAELFLAFNRLALQGFGGVLPVAHRELVERQRWLGPRQFIELLTTAQVLPGPNIVNMALMLGDRWFGLRGALAAAAGLVAVPMVIVLALAIAYQQVQQVPWVAGALRGMGAVAAGLVVATAVKLLRSLHGNPLGRPWALLLGTVTLAAVGLARWPLAGVVLGVGGLGMALAASRIRQADRLRPPDPDAASVAAGTPPAARPPGR